MMEHSCACRVCLVCQFHVSTFFSFFSLPRFCGPKSTVHKLLFEWKQLFHTHTYALCHFHPLTSHPEKRYIFCSKLRPLGNISNSVSVSLYSNTVVRT